jgi:hypothetical protein
MASTTSTSAKRVLLGALATGAILMSGYLLFSGHGPANAQSTRPVVYVDASWSYSYASTAELAQHATIVVVGTVNGVVAEGPDAMSPTLATTRFAFGVDRVVKGSASTSVVVKQSGGALGAIQQVIADDPLMVAGQRYLLYLAQVPTGPYAGDYYVLGGAQGRFAVGPQGQLVPLGSVQAPVGVTATSITAQQ